ncbi:aspartyl-phosphate phosphatase Spo0E family protein [Clostridium sp.]|nr:aspartyl-phosphate phosphatase Spo0E family protein [Clostridium sp.]MBK5242572.1 aspartyl-phosphate phosphatase Spo0E family protein [Clostridium sp.]
MGMQIELLRKKLEKLISVADNLLDSEIISVSQQLDKLILQYYLCEY